MKYELGCCYEVTRCDGTKVVFCARGGSPVMVEVPPGSNKLENFDSLFTSYIEVKEVPCPNIASTGEAEPLP